MKVNKVFSLETCDNLENVDSNVVDVSSTSKKTKTRKTYDKSYLVNFPQQTSVNLIPSHFNHILNTFVSLDIVVNKLIKQRTPLYFFKISEVLKEMNIKNFDMNIFGQILKIFPESYFYEFDKPPLKITRHYKEKLKLIPNLDYGNNIDCLPKKMDKCLRLDQLIFRKSSLYDRLLKIVQQKHSDFLMNDKNISKFEAENVSNDLKWHEEFNLECHIEEIQPIELDRSITDAKLLDKKRTPENTGNIDKSPANKGSPLRDINNIPFSRLSITKNSSGVLKGNAQLLSKSPLTSTNKSASGAGEKKNTPLETSPSHLKPNEARKPISKSPLAANNNLSNLPGKTVENKDKFVTKSPKSTVASQSPSNLQSKAGKSINSPGKISLTCEVSRKSNDKENRLIRGSPLRKSANPPVNVTPVRSASKSSKLAIGDSMNVTPRPPNNQSRLSFTPSSHCGTPRGNYLANLALPDSPMMLMKDEFFLKQKLPAHLKILAEMFISLEKMIYENRRQNKIVSLSMICNKAISKYKFTELQLGRIVNIYPSAYLLRWERVLSANSLKPTNNFDITISPNLMKSRNFLKFDFEIMKERRQIFFENCFEIVVSSYREFLIKNNIVLKNIEEHIKTEDWNKNFNIDLHVKQVEPTSMPFPPQTQERLSFGVIKKRLTDSIDTNQKLSLKDNDKLKSLPKSLMDKVLQNKAKSMIFQQKSGVKLSLLPELVKIIATEFERSKHVPISQSDVASIVCKSLFISEGSFNDYLNKIMELVPEWLEKLRWTSPTLSLTKSNLSLEEVQSRLKKIIAEQA